MISLGRIEELKEIIRAKRLRRSQLRFMSFCKADMLASWELLIAVRLAECIELVANKDASAAQEGRMPLSALEYREIGREVLTQVVSAIAPALQNIALPDGPSVLERMEEMFQLTREISALDAELGTLLDEAIINLREVNLLAPVPADSSAPPTIH